MKRILIFAVVFIAYLVPAIPGLRLDAVSGFATLIWAPTGIAIASVLLAGYEIAPALTAAAFVTNWYTGAPVHIAFLIAIGNTLEAVAARHLLLKYSKFSFSFERRRDIVSFVSLAVVASPVISATIGVLSLWLGGRISEGFFQTWGAWWTGDALGALLVAPFILVWSNTRLNWNPWRALEIGALTIATLVLTDLVFDNFGRSWGITFPALPYLLFPVVLWSAVRFQQVGNVSMSLFLSIRALVATMKGLGPFAHDGVRENILLLHTFLWVFSTTGLVMAAAISERMRAYVGMQMALASRDEFLSIASHELKTPLTTLYLQLQISAAKMKSGTALSPEEIASLLDRSQGQVRRLNKLVEELLDTAKIQMGKLSYTFEHVNLSQVVEDMVQRYPEQMKAAGCRLTCRVQKDLFGEFDAARMEQVLDNLLTNAIKYAPGCNVEVSLDATADKFLLVVKDDGPGISRDQQLKLFNRFERIVSKGSTVMGLGLGLYIVREVVHAHKGEVTVDSDVGKGAIFRVEIPRKPLFA